jgi:hypothetical protein
LSTDTGAPDRLAPIEEDGLRRLARQQGLVVQKRRGRIGESGERGYRLAHWASRAPLVHDTPPPPGEHPMRSADGWLSLGHLHATLLNQDVAGRIDRLWHRLAPVEQQCVLDNAEQLPERFLAGLSAAGIGVPGPGPRLPDSVRRHLTRIGVHPPRLTAPRRPTWDTPARAAR